MPRSLELAILLQKNEQLAEAHELYRRVIEVASNHPRALHYAGVLAHQQGRSNEAVASVQSYSENERSNQ
jgi:Flp pilus assembly protein TadD